MILSVGYNSENEMIQKLKGVAPEVYSIGDCHAPHDGLEATREGMEVRLKV